MRFRLIAAMLIVPILGACASHPATPAPATAATLIATVTPVRVTAVPKATTDVTIAMAKQRQAIQATLDIIAQAYGTSDKALLDSVLDQQNRVFVRLVHERFDQQSPAYKSHGTKPDCTIATIRQRELGFVQVQLNYSHGTVADWLFRNVDGQWKLSEPTAAQLGKPRTVVTEHFIFTAYDWSNDVNAQIMDMLEHAAERVHEQLPRRDKQKAKIVLRPVFDIMGQTAPTWAVGYYQPGPRNSPPRILITLPGSYAFGSYNPDTGWKPALDTILAHEYTHLVNDRSYTPIVRMAPWMSEGLAEYVSGGSGNIRAVAPALERGTLIPIDDRRPTRPLYPADLQHMNDPYSGNDIGLAYGEAHALVKFIIAEYGGIDGFWRFVEDYDRTQSLDKALETGFDTDYATFDQHWRRWITDGSAN